MAGIANRDVNMSIGRAHISTLQRRRLPHGAPHAAKRSLTDNTVQHDLAGVDDGQVVAVPDVAGLHGTLVALGYVEVGHDAVGESLCV